MASGVSHEILVAGRSTHAVELGEDVSHVLGQLSHRATMLDSHVASARVHEDGHLVGVDEHDQLDARESEVAFELEALVGLARGPREYLDDDTRVLEYI